MLLQFLISHKFNHFFYSANFMPNFDCMESLFTSEVVTPIGSLTLITTSTHLVYCNFSDYARLSTDLQSIENHPSIATKAINKTNEITDLTENQLNEYFSETRKSFSLPYQFIGTPFQQKVWHSLNDIPYGQTRTYSQQTNLLGDPKAIRAVASANGKNKLAIIVPCHRVIGSNQSLTGYAGGIERKRFLLNLEGSLYTQPTLFST
jgi:O-6-methylguanine DNA methyltransferase